MKNSGGGMRLAKRVLPPPSNQWPQGKVSLRCPPLRAAPRSEAATLVELLRSFPLEEVRALIDVPAGVRQELESFARQNPDSGEAQAILQVLAWRSRVREQFKQLVAQRNHKVNGRNGFRQNGDHSRKLRQFQIGPIVT